MSKMNIEEILKERLCKEANGTSKRNIVFWYDTEKEFENEIANLAFEGTKIITLSTNNTFSVKYDIEVMDLDSNYLLYAPFEKPKDRENWLLDIQKYSEEFSTDRATYIMQRLGITDVALREVIERNIKFFENEKRFKKLEAFNLTRYDTRSLEIAIISALAKLKIADFDELIKVLLKEYLEGKDDLIKNIIKYSSVDSFYTHIKQRFGYKEEIFKIDEFATTLFYTAFSYKYEGKLPSKLDRFKSPRINEIVIFISEFLKDKNYKQVVEKYSRKFEKVLKIRAIIDEVSTDNFVKCETFKLIDEIIIERIIESVLGGNREFNARIRIAKARRTSLWINSFKNEYEAVINGLEFLRKLDYLSEALNAESLNDLYSMYTNEFIQLDYHYRKFYYYYDKVNNKDVLSKLKKILENKYVKDYLEPTSIQWSRLIENRGLSSLDCTLYKKQSDFYNHFVSDYVKKDERIFVIVSDIMNYEVASELRAELLKERRAEITLKAMQGIIPPHTKTGVAPLLADTVITYGKNEGNAIDSSSTKYRKKILLETNTKSLVISYDDIKNMKSSGYKAVFTGEKLIYIHHNASDKIVYAKSPFEGVEIAIREIKDIVRSLVNHISVAKIIITADPFGVVVPRAVTSYRDQDEKEDLMHGDASLQEMVIPVIEYFDKRSNSFKAKKVEVELTSITRKLTNKISSLEFFQTKSISVKILPLNLLMYFVDAEGKIVSNEVMIIIDNSSSIPKDRSFKKKFLLKDLRYKKEEIYYLVFEDEDRKINRIVKKIPFCIDL
ncbi:BREX-1 system phosphatase PglZ type A [bacterium AH-315-E09]|nr:BREX-1 system phosphatase PglZ type A [bacterium AH-315-G05]MBN4074579.1 BREX-1 system phosphatase PglZ type A [bacterium AH-315-E09]